MSLPLVTRSRSGGTESACVPFVALVSMCILYRRQNIININKKIELSDSKYSAQLLYGYEHKNEQMNFQEKSHHVEYLSLQHSGEVVEVSGDIGMLRTVNLASDVQGPVISNVLTSTTK